VLFLKFGTFNTGRLGHPERKKRQVLYCYSSHRKMSEASQKPVHEPNRILKPIWMKHVQHVSKKYVLPFCPFCNCSHHSLPPSQYQSTDSKPGPLMKALRQKTGNELIHLHAVQAKSAWHTSSLPWALELLEADDAPWVFNSFSYKRSSVELCDPTAACPGYPGSKVPGFINWFWMVYTLDMPVQAQRLNPNSVFFRTWLVVPLLFP